MSDNRALPAQNADSEQAAQAANGAETNGKQEAAGVPETASVPVTKKNHKTKNPFTARKNDMSSFNELRITPLACFTGGIWNFL